MWSTPLPQAVGRIICYISDESILEGVQELVMELYPMRQEEELKTQVQVTAAQDIQSRTKATQIFSYVSTDNQIKEKMRPSKETLRDDNRQEEVEIDVYNDTREDNKSHADYIDDAQFSPNLVQH